MSKQLTFNYIKDINGINKRYPKDSAFVALFMTASDGVELEYYVYAACTKRDYSNPELIQVTEDVYSEIKGFFAARGIDDLSENLLNNESEIHVLLKMVSDTVVKENQTVGDMLKLI